MLADIGFDFDAGRQDRSAHPFTTTIALHDIRLTTRIDEADPFSALSSTLHEAGHGLYDQGFDPEYEDTPIAQAPSLGLHESQSRLWENLVGRSLPFWRRYTPVMHEVFGDTMRGATPEDIHRQVNRVTPSLIRVEADEVTYNMHILVRFELEVALLRDELSAADLPAAWNDAYRRRLGVAPATDGDGRAPGRALVVGGVRLLPDVHDRQPLLGAALEHDPGRHPRHRGPDRGRRVRAAPRLAARPDPPARATSTRART